MINDDFLPFLELLKVEYSCWAACQTFLVVCAMENIRAVSSSFNSFLPQIVFTNLRSPNN